MIGIDSTICIYCKNHGFSKEHVAPFSLGGNCTIKCVCKDCNGKLSSVDQSLAENSPVALSKVGMTPTAAFGTQLGTIATMRDQRGFDLGVRIGNQMTVEVRPQIFLRGNQLSISCPDRQGIQKLVRYIDDQIRKGSLADVHQRITPDTIAPRFMMHRSDAAVVDAASSEEASKLLAVIEKNWPDVKTTLEKPDAGEVVKQATPSVLIKMVMKPNEEYRGVAKIALETTALLLGPEFVLRDTLDPIREYILGDVRLPVIDGDTPDQLAIDARFVERVPTENSFDFTDQHGVILFHEPQHGLAALVVLYGMHHYKVRLAPPMDRSSWVRHYEFSYTKDGHRELSELDFARRALERFPHLLKIDPGIATKMLEALKGETR